MPDARRASAAPWIATGAALVAMIAAILAYVLVGNDTKAAQRHVFTSEEHAAGTETANLLSFRRAHFEADFARALNGATGSIKTDIEGKKATTLKTLTAGKFDLTADVLHIALVGPAEGKGTGYVVLVSLNGYRSTQKDLPTQQNLRVSVEKKSGKWLVSDVQNIGVS